MTIKVCGMREGGNIRAVAALGIDLMGFIFWPKSPRYVQAAGSWESIIPDHSPERQQARGGADEAAANAKLPQRVGVFVDDMPQNIVAHVHNYNLDYVQLHGHESRVVIENLRSTLDLDIRPGIKIIKAISVKSADDLRQCSAYEGVADLFLFDTKTPLMGGSGRQFDWEVLSAYDGQTPFLLSGGIGPEDVERLRAFRHPQFAGIDLNSRFETAPGVKDVGLLRKFLKEFQQ